MSTSRAHRDYQYETPHFLLRQVTEEDAPALLRCYSDPAAVARMNADNCMRGFLCETEEDLRAYIRIWQSEDLMLASKKSPSLNCTASILQENQANV